MRRPNVGGHSTVMDSTAHSTGKTALEAKVEEETDNNYVNKLIHKVG